MLFFPLPGHIKLLWNGVHNSPPVSCRRVAEHDHFLYFNTPYIKYVSANSILLKIWSFIFSVFAVYPTSNTPAFEYIYVGENVKYVLVNHLDTTARTPVPSLKIQFNKKWGLKSLGVETGYCKCQRLKNLFLCVGLRLISAKFRKEIFAWNTTNNTWINRGLDDDSFKFL